VKHIGKERDSIKKQQRIDVKHSFERVRKESHFITALLYSILEQPTILSKNSSFVCDNNKKKKDDRK